MKHIISMLIENESGALSRVAGLFSARGYNIQALTVAPTEDESLSRLTLVTLGNAHQIEQIVKHLNRLIDVVKVVDLTEGAHIERELMLIKLSAVGDYREEFVRLADIFRGTIVDVTATTYTVQMIGETQKLDAFIAAIDPALILETVRSGAMGIMRGEKCLQI
ncbi:acetolactate synthase small subunit [Thiomicrospira microaerophila]|uniref:acetolactate synthase small subunit n=1 Tax=Thiomicrospira microaerophila TaxID=406020 RepID=UPI00200CB111|nr:acetolactate synthase small subunit [Thiomicrospira microaerophila]UQB41806.1 acetolactate synthase small subunit [Thiomicrospira microaerophila]